ncbi:type II secretion system protein GspC [Aliikangiella sp. G2MR2-5]|uniref:type II secretion system protein GspC n=1 Tax=Aliikangiella sp. G2MR2-5 TaxID=2788943 RepID=UPI0018AA0656|nr:type II secretion system protein GspC [Aliikangiella sp. G2MR2-5]
MMLDKMNLSQLKSTNWLTNYAFWGNCIQWLGVFMVALLMARIFWVWVDYFSDTSEAKPVKVAINRGQKSLDQIDVSSIINRNIFGSLVKQEEVRELPKENIEETKLNLKLRGIYAADTPSKANAIIEDSRGQQAVYFIDEKLEVSGRVYLRQVYVDKVILETNGRREALTLDTEKLPNTAIIETKGELKESDDKKVEDKRNNQRLSQQLNRYKDQFERDPASMADIINGRPHMVDGELKGFEISPGKDRRLFQELGLRRGDIVTSVNGVQLTSMQEAMSLMSDMKSMSEMNIEIQRGDEQLSLLLNLNEKVGL